MSSENRGVHVGGSARVCSLVAEPVKPGVEIKNQACREQLEKRGKRPCEFERNDQHDARATASC